MMTVRNPITHRGNQMQPPRKQIIRLYDLCMYRLFGWQYRISIVMCFFFQL